MLVRLVLAILVRLVLVLLVLVELVLVRLVLVNLVLVELVLVRLVDLSRHLILISEILFHQGKEEIHSSNKAKSSARVLSVVVKWP
jgi:hypothetical protein